MLLPDEFRADEADPTEADPAAKTHAEFLRYDRIDLMPPTRSPEGFMIYEGRVARPGIYLYRNADGSTRRELVPPEVLFNEDDLKTLGMKPVTLGHPPEGKVTPKTSKRYSVGSTSPVISADIKRDGTGGFVRVVFNVTDEAAISAIESGRYRQMSPGYAVRIDNTPGIDPVFGAFDCRQIGRVYNHCAAVPAARGGASCELRADGNQLPEVPLNEDLLKLLLAIPGMTRADAEDMAGSPFAGLMAKHLNETHQMLEMEKAEHGKTKDALKAECDAHTAAKAKMKGIDDERAAMEQDVPPADKKDGKDEPMSAYALRYAARHAKVAALAKTHKIDVVDSISVMEKALIAKADPKAPTNESGAYYRARVDSLDTVRVDHWRDAAGGAPEGGTDWTRAGQGGRKDAAPPPTHNASMRGILASRGA